MSEEKQETVELLHQAGTVGSDDLFQNFIQDIFAQLVSWSPTVWGSIAEFFGGQLWLLLLVIVLIITFSIDLIVRTILKTLAEQFSKKNKIFLLVTVTALKIPVSFYIWLSGVMMALFLVFKSFSLLQVGIPYLAGLKSNLALISVAWFSIRLVGDLENNLQRLESMSKWDPVTIEALVKIFKLTVFIFTALFVLSSLGVNLTGLIAFGGMGGIAVGFAAKDLVGNLIGGLMIYIDKPFKVGEWVRSPDKSIEGTVEKIGWRMTVIRTFDKRPLYIPNGTFSTISIENPTRMNNRRIKETVGVRYDDLKQVESISEAIKQMLIDNDDIDKNQTLFVYLGAFGASTLDIDIYTFTKTTKWVEYRRIKQEVLLAIANIIEAHGAEIAFPTRTIHMVDSVDSQPI
jgi:MscS family membrane protein